MLLNPVQPLDAQMAELVQLRGWQGAAYASTVLSGNTCQISPSGSNCVCTKTSEKSSPSVPSLLDLGLGIWIRKESLGVSWSPSSQLQTRTSSANPISPEPVLQQGSCQVNGAQLETELNVQAGVKKRSWGFPCLHISWINSDKAL